MNLPSAASSPAPGASHPASVPFSRALLLFLGVSILFSLGNLSLPLIDRDEPRFAEASREMMQSGNWIVPTFNNAPRYDKPPLIYWMQVGCYRLLGDNAFAARLPAALCTGAIAVLLLLWGARIADPQTGFRAAWIFALCLQVFLHGRAAVADPPMVLCVLASAWMGWELLQRPASRPLAFAFWITLALGFLAKGPVAWVPIGMLAWASLRGPASERNVPHALFWIFGSIGMLSLVGLWGIPALLQTKGAFAAKGLGEHVVGRSLIAMEGHGAKGILGYLATLPLYFLTVFPSFAPWSFWLPKALQFHRARPSLLTRYLLTGTLLTFTIFTLSRTKLPHYTLPAFPFLALLLALWWKEARPTALFRKVASFTVAAFVALPLFVFPFLPRLSVSEQIAAELLPLLSPDTSIALVDYEEPSLIWCLRKTIRAFPERIAPERIEAWLSLPGPRCCIFSDRVPFPAQSTWKTASAKGWNFAKGKRLTLQALCANLQTPLGTPAEKPTQTP